MSQIWVPIAIAFFGNAVAVSIVLLTNRHTVKRDEARQVREDGRLELLRKDARVDRAVERHKRMVELQKDYYIALYLELRSSSLAIHNAGYEIGPKLKEDWQLPAYEALLRLRVFATGESWMAGETAYKALWRWGDSSNEGFESDEEVDYEDAIDAYLKAIRHDLGIELDEARLSVDDEIK